MAARHDPDEQRGGSTWPPAPEGELPRLPLGPVRDEPLRLDRLYLPEQEHEFRPGKLAGREAAVRPGALCPRVAPQGMQVAAQGTQVAARGTQVAARGAPVAIPGARVAAPGSDSGLGPVRAVVYDPKNPSGRTAADAIFDVRDEDFARRARRLLMDCMIQGAVLGLLVMFSAGSPPAIGYLLAAAAGAVGGVLARALGDSSFAWFAGMTVTGGVIGGFLGGVPSILAPAGAAALGWIGGLVREVSQR